MKLEDLIGQDLKALSPDELRRVHQERQERFGLLSLELSRRRAAGRLHLPAAEAPVVDAGPHQRMIVGPELGFNIHNFHIFTSGRAAGSDRYHTHGDAVKYYVAGHGFEVIGDQRFEVKPGDFMHVPGNIWHGTENPSDEPLIFLAAQQFPGTFRQVPTPFLHENAPHLRPPEVPDFSEQSLAGMEPWPLYLLYMEQQVAFGRALLELQRRRGEQRVYIPADQAPLMGWGPGRHPIVTPELGFDIYSFQVCLVHLSPGQQHTRLTGGDVVKYCLSGIGEETVGETPLITRRGDFLHVPSGSPNQTRSAGPDPLRYLCWEQIPGTFTQVPSPFLRPLASEEG